MGPIKAITHCMAHPFTWDGRAKRSEYWGFHLGFPIVLLLIVAAVVVGYIGPAYDRSVALGNPEIFNSALSSLAIPGILALIVFVWSFFASLAVTIRRLHDISHSGWWYFITMVPAIGHIWMFILTIWPTDDNDNQWGPSAGNPAQPSAKAEARRSRNLEAYMQPRTEIDVHDTPDAIRALRHARMPTT